MVTLLPEQENIQQLGGTMRLGAHTTVLKKGSLIHRIYNNADTVRERHRHRYEVNPEFVAKFESAGLIFSGWSEDKRRMEMLELKNHRFFVATQAHPEFKSRPGKPAPLFLALVKAALDFHKEKHQSAKNE